MAQKPTLITNCTPHPLIGMHHKSLTPHPPGLSMKPRHVQSCAPVPPTSRDTPAKPPFDAMTPRVPPNSTKPYICHTVLFFLTSTIGLQSSALFRTFAQSYARRRTPVSILELPALTAVAFPNRLSVRTPSLPKWKRPFPSPPPLVPTPPELNLDMHSRPPPRSLPASVEMSDVPHGRRAHIRRTAKSTRSHPLDAWKRSSLLPRHTSPLPYESPLIMQSFHRSAPPQPTLWPKNQHSSLTAPLTDTQDTPLHPNIGFLVT